VRHILSYCAVSLAALGFGSVAAHAEDAVSAHEEEAIVSSTSGNDWSFTAAPYLWATGLEGDIGLFGFQPQDVDLSFGDVLDNLEFGFMGVFEGRNGPYTLGVEMFYADIGTTINTPVGIAATSIDADVTTFFATAYGGYAVVDDGSATVDVFGGLRFWSVDNDFSFNGGVLGGTTASDGGDWVDPVIGIKFRKDYDNNFFVSGWGMVGGFGVSSDMMWDAMGIVGYEFTDVTSVILGYRAAGVDYSSGGFVFDTVMKGPIIGAAFRF